MARAMSITRGTDRVGNGLLGIGAGLIVLEPLTGLGTLATGLKFATVGAIAKLFARSGDKVTGKAE